MRAEKARAQVALVKGDDRYANITQALELIAGDVAVGQKHCILIKPNFVSTTRQLAATHVEAVRAVLEFLKSRTRAEIVIAEGAALADTFDGYRNFGYQALARDYHVTLVDLNREAWVPLMVYDRDLRPFAVRVARTVVESDYRISVGPPKTHDVVVVTLSLKNMVMGSVIREETRGPGNARVLSSLGSVIPQSVKRSPLYESMKSRILGPFGHSDKFAMHQGYPALNLNLYLMGRYVYPHLAVIDGFEAMEGDGPTFGDPVELRLAIASADFLAADTVATRIMGFDVNDVGYLHYCRRAGLGTGDLARIAILGAPLAESLRPFKPHSTIAAQRAWWTPEVEECLAHVFDSATRVAAP